MKYTRLEYQSLQGESLSARTVWIEMQLTIWLLPAGQSLSARTVWIEMLCDLWSIRHPNGHCLRGQCGLKCLLPYSLYLLRKSLSARTVWIEISTLKECVCVKVSLSARTVWIEIIKAMTGAGASIVTVCEDSVD